MKRKIVEINEEKCNGCNACVKACHEGAIALVNGKAKLMRDDYCDGLGDCLPACPQDAIRIIEREALPYDEAAVLQNMNQALSPCQQFNVPKIQLPNEQSSCLRQWPVQLRLVHPQVSYFNNCDLLLAADCSAYARADFHQRFMKDRVTIIACPKLDPVDYSIKLTEILSLNNIRSITLVKMEVPCCNGLANAIKKAIANSKKDIPLSITTITSKGDLL